VEAGIELALVAPCGHLIGGTWDRQHHRFGLSQSCFLSGRGYLAAAPGSTKPG
jgi:hypothetical protein